ncbi:shugoshin 2 isoform X2 [Pseudophryne corroboree]|uniref:shugoshin 2 isoform X2 n=1 Tax=Pseudophryne corroboree TaxID=495146 RepID=UPI00308154B3
MGCGRDSSSFLKVSLKNNNKALACALTAERQKARSLENEKMFLQKEVKMLHFQNAVLRQNLSIVNTMLKDIDLFMNVNLPAAIEISSTMEPSDRLSSNTRKSERFSHQSAGSQDAYPGFRLTGMALRVPSSSVELQKHNAPADVVSDGLPLILSPSTRSSADRERSDRQPERESYSVTSKDRFPTFIENITPDNVSIPRVSNPVILLDEVLSSCSKEERSDRFVTTRRKRSTISRSSTVTLKSDHSKSSTGSSRESSHSTQWDMGTPTTVLPDPGHAGFGGEMCSHFDLVMERNRSSISHSQLEKIDLDKGSSIVTPAEQVPATANQPAHAHPAAGGCVEPEKTVYEADMEMTSSDTAAIVAIASKTHSSKSRSNIPIRQDGTSLRKVRQSGRQKTKKKSISSDPQKNKKSTKSHQMTEAALESGGKMTPENKSSADLNPSLLGDRHDYRRTYILPGPVKLEKSHNLESISNSDPVCEMEISTEPAGQELSEKIPALLSGTNELMLNLESKPCIDKSHNATGAGSVGKRKSKNRTRASKTMEHSPKRKRKRNACLTDQENVVECAGNIDETHEQPDNSKNVIIPDFNFKKQETQIRRETYVVSSAQPLPVTTELKSSKAKKISYRRETFVIPKPNPLASIANMTFDSEETTETKIDPLLILKKTDPRNSSDPGSDKPYDHKAEKLYKCPEKKARLRKKTLIAPAKEDDACPDKGTLVRESTAHLSTQTNKPTKMLKAILSSKRDSFTLDMVSESILDETLEGPSFVEFPSATNPDSTFSVDGSLKASQSSEHSAPENRNPKDMPRASKIFNVLDESHSGGAPDILESNNYPQRRTEKQSMEIQEPAIKPFQDLTNKVLGSKKPPKSCSEDEKEDDDDDTARSSRRRKPVNYKLPSLTCKLRR